MVSRLGLQGSCQDLVQRRGAFRCKTEGFRVFEGTGPRASAAIRHTCIESPHAVRRLGNTRLAGPADVA